jgi:protease I
MPQINAAKILIMSTHGFEQSELMMPLQKLRQAGAAVHVGAPEPGEITGWDQKDWGQSVPVDVIIGDISASDYDALVLPGGQMNPDILRAQPKAVSLIRDFYDQGKVVAAICHAPWLLIEAGVAEGHRMTSYGSIKTDVRNAGAHWVDEAVVTDKGLITSRKPEDLDAFVAKIIEEIEEGEHPRDAATGEASNRMTPAGASV